MREALELLHARRIVLVTPYDRAVTEREATFFDGAGREVVGMVSRSLAGSDAYCSEPPSAWASALVGAARADADAYVLSCANISCFSIIAEAEEVLARPLVTSNQAVLWAALKATGASRPARLGALMRAG
jgi:maleate isomerase